MSSATSTFYTNEVSPDFLRTFDKSPFTEQQLSSFNEQALERVKQQQEYKKSHPPIAIYRIAAQGSQTRNGGVIKQTTSPMEFKLPDGQQIRAAQKGDYAEYPDGTNAQIVTVAGEIFYHIALVGSVLNNGDEIINTLQDSSVLVERKGVSLPADFLPSIEAESEK